MVDMVQLHWWDYSVPGMMDVMNVLADLQAEGRIRSIGATNLDTAAVEKITDADINLVSNQVAYNKSECFATWDGLWPVIKCLVADMEWSVLGQGNVSLLRRAVYLAWISSL